MYKVTKTLFAVVELLKGAFKGYKNLDVKEDLLRHADKQLTEKFIFVTGISPSKNVCMGIDGINDVENAMYTINKKNYIKATLYINHNWNPITICWYSKSGKEYKIDDPNLDCDDIIFDFASELDTKLYISQLYPNQKLPFKIETPFELQVNRLNRDCEILLTVKKEEVDNRQSIITEIENFLIKFNDKPQSKIEKEGVVPNYKFELLDADKIVIDVELGYVGFNFFKSILKKLIAIDKFVKVSIE
jgi:hypothetical protein